MSSSPTTPEPSPSTGGHATTDAAAHPVAAASEVAATADTTVAGDAAAVVVAAAGALDEAVVRTVRDVHAGIAARVFRLTPGSRPVQVVHDAVSSRVYRAVSAGLRAAATGGAALLSATGRGEAWLDGDPARSTAWSIAHGVLGERLDTGLHLPVRVRVAGRDVAPTPDDLVAAFPDARPRVAVFLHGLTESERSWDAPRGRRGSDEAPPADTVVLPDVVDELGWTPVRLRYGTGGAIGANGIETAQLLDALCAAWPADVDELALIGHSMGGLVFRSAIAHGQREGHAWVDRVEHTVNLGTPHLGSWLERVASRGTYAARNSRLSPHLPELAAVGRIIDLRARGIKDLRYGALDDDSWGDGVFDDGVGDLDRPLPPPTTDTPLLDGAVHHLVAGRLRPSPSHPLTKLFGDLLVHPASALGDDGRRQLHGAQVEELTVDADHFAMMRHPRVADHLRTWLA